MVAGLPPQVGLYSSIFPGLVYAVFGSCKDVTVGPTAILAALLAKYVARSPDFAYLAAFLSGCLILLLGVLQLGFLLDFISKPVISGFTTAAALQISASQLKSLFRIEGSSGGTFVKALGNFFKHIRTLHPWDTALGVCCIVALLVLKRTMLKASPTRSTWRAAVAAGWLYVVRARNALVVLVASLLAYALFKHNITPFALTGKIDGGLPRFGPPPFSTVVKNETLGFQQMLAVFGPEGLAMPLVAVLESIAIAKAFGEDGGQQASGRDAGDGGAGRLQPAGVLRAEHAGHRLLHAHGAQPRQRRRHARRLVVQSEPGAAVGDAAGGRVLLHPARHARRRHYGGHDVHRRLLHRQEAVAQQQVGAGDVAADGSCGRVGGAGVRHRGGRGGGRAAGARCGRAPAPAHRTVQGIEWELATWLLTVVVGAWAGLEYGIAAGAAADALRALAAAARPHLHTVQFKVGNQECILLTLAGTLGYASAEHVPRKIRALQSSGAHVLVIDGSRLRRVDIGVVENVISAILELQKKEQRVLLWNFSEQHRRVFASLQPALDCFVSGPSVDPFVLGIDVDRRFPSLSTVT
ncbi:uncharacterized protein LOC112053410 isoform X1 [Bicyclus anynana]|uniref:Uncharacterized protein LOC112053410 isoform X1 n=1 Tax=Bicyclus anynana TaxID=110368 RepID=A0ABM3LLW4_BICAN|nr:uncharacterized protein LOC112053410 isoform X1 [Bicyclus anynana]